MELYEVYGGGHNLESKSTMILLLMLRHDMICTENSMQFEAETAVVFHAIQMHISSCYAFAMNILRSMYSLLCTNVRWSMLRPENYKELH